MFVHSLMLLTSSIRLHKYYSWLMFNQGKNYRQRYKLGSYHYSDLHMLHLGMVIHKNHY